MDDRTRAVMHSTFPKLDQEGYDDVESQFENLRVISTKVGGEWFETKKHAHRPALELLVGEITYDQMIDQAEALRFAGPGALPSTIYDYVYRSILFGIEIGKMGWPVQQMECEEVHDDD